MIRLYYDRSIEKRKKDRLAGVRLGSDLAAMVNRMKTKQIASK